MAKKITIQHYYTTGSTAPAASALTLGEIAIATSAGTESIFIKNNTGTIVDFPTRKQIVDYVDLKTKGIATSGEIETLDNKISGHITGLSSTDNFGHVKLVGGDLDWATGNTITSGEAAASYHTHGQYLETISLNTNDGGLKKTPGLNGTPASYGVKTGTGITVDSNGVSISEEYRTKIANGVTAHSWGNHADKGYAKNSDLTAHTGSADIHVTTGDKNKWNTAANAVTNSAETWNETTTKVNTSASTWNTAAERINTFMDSEQIDGAVDTLKEIQQFLDGTGSTVQTLLDNLSELTTDVENNTTAITENTNNITTISGNVNTISGRVDTLSTNLENVFTNFTHSITGTGSNIKVEKKDVTEKSYEISHTPASTQASAITVTNSNSTVYFGSNFNIVNKIAYDANGHVVSGSTQTLTLQDLPTADADTAGIVKIKHGAIGLDEELLSNPTGIAADVCHHHTQYVKLIDLYSGNTSSNITISCGTY
jgi:archaellum component FlaC